jgi:hypothetical protein
MRDFVMAAVVTFRPNKRKIIEAILYLATSRPRIDAFHVCKILFYADRDHLLRFGRPILGDAYFAMPDGPVPSFALDVAKRNSRMVSRELLKIAAEKLAVDESDGYVRLTARDTFDDTSFSRTDLECLDAAIDKYADLPFLELWRMVHDEPEWKANYREGTSTIIPYEHFIPENMPNRAVVIEQLREHAGATEL